ncbi:hypothetical protein C8R46DRAFT_1356344 [Mycena filopes]|nr:hypothetical protein C8R46DRAFT_1356344 [Mycena filopes]
MDFVDITRSVSRTRKSPAVTPLAVKADDAATPSSSTALPPPGRFKRVRPISPPLTEDSAATVVEDRATPRISPQRSTVSLTSHSTTLRPVSPVAEPPAKRVKKNVKVEPLQDVATLYLANIPNLQIAPPASDKSFSRKFLQKQYKASAQTFLGTFEFQDAARPHREAVFPQAWLNPFLPPVPGAPGLIFASRMEIVEDPAPPAPPWALFLRGADEALWRYMGDYRNRRCGSLTAAQFKSQTAAVQTKWGNLLLGAKKCHVYIAMRARIALRKAGRAFVPGDEVEAREIRMVKTQKKGRALQTLPLTVPDIVAALGRGDETIDIIRLECVAYDQAFIAELAERQLAPEDEPSGPAKPPKAKKGTLGKGKAKAKTNTKRRRDADSGDESASSAFEPESEADSDGGSDNDGRPQARRQRTNRAPSPQLGSVTPPPLARSPSRSQTPKLGWDDPLSDMSEVEEEVGSEGSEEV